MLESSPVERVVVGHVHADVRAVVRQTRRLAVRVLHIGEQPVLERTAQRAVRQLEAAELADAVAIGVESEERVRDVARWDRRG